MNDDPLQYQDLAKRFIGNIWDSGVDVEGIPFGVPKAVTDNENIQKSLEKYLR